MCTTLYANRNNNDPIVRDRVRPSAETRRAGRYVAHLLWVGGGPGNTRVIGWSDFAKTKHCTMSASPLFPKENADLFVSPATTGTHAQCNVLIGKGAWIPAYAETTNE